MPILTITTPIRHLLNSPTYEEFSAVHSHQLKSTLLHISDEKQFFYKPVFENTFDIEISELISKLNKLGIIFNINGCYGIFNEKYILIAKKVDSFTKNKIGIVFDIFTTFEYGKTCIDEISNIFFEYNRIGKIVRIDWGFISKGDLVYSTIHNSFNEIIYSESYPYILPSLDEFVNEYINSTSPILILIGKPGTGKTRLLKYIIQSISNKTSENSKILYTMESLVFENDNFFINFLRSDYTAMVLEDIDINLKSRTDGNFFMHKLLGAADGFVINNNKKILLSTNLSNVNDIDVALLRPGRCFDKIQTRKLLITEANLLAKKINPNTTVEFECDIDLATIYSEINQAKSHEN